MEFLNAAIQYSAPLARFAQRHPQALEAITLDPFARAPKPALVMMEELTAALHEVTDENHLLRALRDYRSREMIRILARDLASAPFQEVALELSDLASALLDHAIAWHSERLADAYGKPLLTGAQTPCTFVALGMGKLGGRELNYSSDIDLVYLYASDEATTPSGHTPHEIYSRLATRVGRALSEPTEDGIAFRVDLDLRPEGRSGPSVNSVRSALVYYEGWGQTWERFALLKARPVAGDHGLGRAFLADVEPFVYRRTLDYTTLDAIREMKQRIEHRANRSGPRDDFDVKMDRGGIRELEFFVQALILLNGGRHPQVRDRSTLGALERLSNAGLLPAERSLSLAAAYRFLRTLEHRIQGLELSQTHRLPSSGADRERIAASLGFAEEKRFADAIAEHRERVADSFDELFGAPADPSAVPVAALLFERDLTPQEETSLLAELPFTDLETARSAFDRMRTGPRSPTAEAARRYLARMAATVVEELRSSPDPDAALRNLERFIGAVGARTTLLALLAENPATTKTLVKLFGSSDHLSGLFINHPELLDQLVRADSGSPRRSRRACFDDLETALVHSGETEPPEASFEERLDAIRRFRHAEVLRVGLAALAGEIDVEDVCVQLSHIADACVAAALRTACAETNRMRGGTHDLPDCVSGFLVVALGGLGGRELRFGSDLDLVFFYDPQSLPNELANAPELGARLGQRLITALATPTREGIAFRVDMRLRPSGTAGPLAVTPEAFAGYHSGGTETWERLALLRARAITGDPRLWRTVRELLRDAVFTPSKNPAELAADVVHMRERLEKEIAREFSGPYNLKTGRGGLVDVEFIVQYLQLVHGSARPEIRTARTLSGIRRLVAGGMLTPTDGDILTEAYRFLRLLENRLRIVQDRPVSELPRDPLAAGRLALRAGLGRRGTINETGEQLLAEYEETTSRVRGVFERLTDSWQNSSSS